MEFDRRDFLKGAAVVGGVVGGVAAVSSLTACSPDEEAPAANGSEETEVAYTPVGTYEADLCVVGTGMSGLAATVQALQEGLAVVSLEQTGYPGAAAYGVEGIFTVNSKAQQAEGVPTVLPSQITPEEQEYEHFRTDGTKLLDFITHSGENVDWLIENGCTLLPGMDDQHMGYTADRQKACYITPMYEKAKALGGEVLVNTKAIDLKREGETWQVFAEKKNGDVIQINAKAVLLSTGGYTDNNDYLRESGIYKAEDTIRMIPGINGDGLTFARKVGGDDFLKGASVQLFASLRGAPGGEAGTFGNANAMVVNCRSANTMWVNENAERFCSEVGGMMFMTRGNVLIPHKAVYSIFDAAIWEKNLASGLSDDTGYFLAMHWQYDEAKCREEFEQRFSENPYGDAFKADTIEDLCQQAADAFGLDSATLLANVQAYQAMCRDGLDSDYGKPVDYLMDFSNPPFYLVELVPAVMNTYGAICTSKKYEVFDADRNPIPGLYSAGTDGVDIWKLGYKGGGHCSASNLHSGRTVGKSAAAYIGDQKLGAVKKEGDTSPSVVEYSYDMPSSLKDGTYTSDPMPGMFGDIVATVVVSGGKITEVSETNDLETEYIGGYAMDDLAKAIVAAQDVNVDAVAGATATCNGFRRAVESALKKAAG
ncbi:MAG: FAD-binding protein [Bifidobacteriaceae bacterium]|jgi:fumarate reductase flavoprotein subunit|nr:FAD-binding protein [Bifidobacteriaceae bacterium]